MNNQKAMMSSATAEWGTPQSLYDALDAIYHFDLDPCSTHANHKAPYYFTKDEDGLKQSWALNGQMTRVYMNPPYGREIADWMAKAEFESESYCATVVCLVPARTDNRWFQRAFKHAKAVVFMPGRIKFVGEFAPKAPAPFPSALIIYAPTVEAATPKGLEEFGQVMVCEPVATPIQEESL